MIQIWIQDEESTKYAYFSAGVARFATLGNDASLDGIRAALLASSDVRNDIQPRSDKGILWHDSDKDAIAAHFQQMIDDAQYAVLSTAIGSDIYRYIVYILKFLELMSAQLGIIKLADAVILGHEAGADPVKQQELAATWSAKSDAWLTLVGIAEREASKAKASISDSNNVESMQSVVDGFPTVLSEALQ